MSQQPTPDIEKIRQLNEVNQALLQQKERLELIIRGTNDGIWDWNIETGQFYFSERWASMLGYQLDELAQTFHGWLDLVHPDDLGRFLFTWTEYMEGITSHFDIEYRLRHKLGHYCWVEGRGVSSINAQGFPYRMAGANSDIHSRKMAEELLVRAKESAEDASQMQRRFLSTMSHELRTPLNAIIGFSEIIKDELTERQEPALLNDINRIHTAGSHLLSLVNQVLDMAAIENHELQLSPTAFKINKLVTAIQEKMAPRIKDNLIDYHIAPDLGIAYLDYDRVITAVFNLIDNANKFTHAGKISVEVSKNEHWLFFKISDSGIGIPPDQLKKIFDPFFQIDNSYSRKYDGSGLGLTISKYYIHLMGGDIKASSTIDQGSLFTVNVPLEWEPQ